MIADLYPCSFIDYPQELCAVIFTQGCNLRCRYCHNPELCPTNGKSRMEMADIIRFLVSRKNKLTAVTVTGGEPTQHTVLPELLSTIRALGYKIKLDTNGTRPDVVRDLIREGLVDYTAVDVKIAPGVDGTRLTGVANQGERAIETLALLSSGNRSCEARTTVIRGIHNDIHLSYMARCLAAAGVKTWRLQPVQPGVVLDPAVCLEAPSDATLARAVNQAETLGLDAAIRRGSNPTVTLPNELATSQLSLV